MTAQKPHPALEYIPDFPHQQPLSKAVRRWCRETWWFVVHTITPTETTLPEPTRVVTQPADLTPPTDLKERLAAAKAIVDSAEARLNTVRSKATSLLGFVALVIPLVSWWLLSGRARLTTAPVVMEVGGYVLMVLCAVFLSLSLLALIRSQGIVSYPCQTPDLIVDFEKGQLKAHDWAADLRGQASAWGAVQRWSDVVTDFYRAGQRFLVLSLVMAVLAGGASYLYPQPTKPISLVQKPSGEVALVVDASGGIIDPDSRWMAALWNLISFVAGGGVMTLISWLYFRKYWRPIAAGPERKNLIRLTPIAAEKVRQMLTGTGWKYVRAKAEAMSSGQPTRKLYLEESVNPEQDYIGESQGVEIVVARACADLVLNSVVDWTDNDNGGGFYFAEDSSLPLATP